MIGVPSEQIIAPRIGRVGGNLDELAAFVQQVRAHELLGAERLASGQRRRGLAGAVEGSGIAIRVPGKGTVDDPKTALLRRHLFAFARPQQ